MERTMKNLSVSEMQTVNGGEAESSPGCWLGWGLLITGGLLLEPVGVIAGAALIVTNC
jgi:hypothetical protein